jgi:hypothetical protein
MWRKRLQVLLKDSGFEVSVGAAFDGVWAAAVQACERWSLCRYDIVVQVSWTTSFVVSAGHRGEIM